MGMLECINQFVDTMVEEQHCFENMQNEISRREDDVLQELTRLEASEREGIDQIQRELEKSNDEDMQEIFRKTSEDRIPYEYVRVVQVPREPEGFFEKIGKKVFKKEYYSSEQRKETRYSTFDIGVNDNEIAQNIVLQLSTVFSDTVERYIDFLTKGYYEPIEQLQRITINGIEKTISNLKEMRM